ncbi:MAG TPA: glycosyltransferase family 39 protein [Gemmatimonadales bacterium]|nr:glycosyltransferase family 39 protein [Gemmatimonadales bacterium]
MTRPQREVLGVILLLGIVVRLGPFLAAPAMYLDEAMLALNLATRDWGGLTHPLIFEQSAPVLYLWLSRLVVVIAGVTEHTLRLLPLLAGILLPAAVWYFSRRLLSANAALLATAFAALSPLVVWYSNVVKPYTLDALVATLLLLGALKAKDSTQDRPWAVLAVAGLIAPFLSAPSVFILAGVLLALLPGREAWKQPRVWRYLAVIGGVSVGAGANYLIFQRGMNEVSYLTRFWDRAFLGPPDSSMLARLSSPVSGFTQLFFYRRGVDFPALILLGTLALAGIGLFSLHRAYGWRWTALCVTPVLAVALASLFRIYPLTERLLLFLAPLVAVIAAAGVEYLVTKLPPHRRALGLAIVGCAGLFVALRTDIRNVLRPHSDGAEVRPMLTQYDTSRSPGDPVYLYARGVPIWAYYTTDWSHPDQTRLNSLLSLAQKIGPNSGNNPSRRRPVEHEGFDLVVPAGDHDELVGTPSGVEILYARADRRAPDPGWADNEVARMRAAGGRQIWVVLTHYSTEVEADLEAAIRRAGGTIAEDWREWAARLWQVHFSAPNQPF